MFFKENDACIVETDEISTYVPVHIRDALALKLKKESEKVSLSVDPFVSGFLPAKFQDSAMVKTSRFGPYIE
jgi:hypothetical protein